MNEKTIQQTEQEVLIYETSDHAIESAGTESRGVDVCCRGIQCHEVFE